MYSTRLQKSARTTGKYKEVLAALDKCVFCDLRDKYIIDKKDHVVLSVNLFPYIDGQLIIIPERHVEKLHELTATEWSAIKTLIDQALKLLKEVYNINDVNIIYREGERSGKTVWHLHINIIPYCDKLMTWNYQEITEEPLHVAERLRSNSNH